MKTILNLIFGSILLLSCNDTGPKISKKNIAYAVIISNPMRKDCDTIQMWNVKYLDVLIDKLNKSSRDPMIKFVARVQIILYYSNNEVVTVFVNGYNIVIVNGANYHANQNIEDYLNTCFNK